MPLVCAVYEHTYCKDKGRGRADLKKRKSIYYNLPDEALMDMSFETLDVCKTVNQILPMTHKKTRTNIETNNL